jgi:tetratricopeptide (TPR) repeat protein
MLEVLGANYPKSLEDAADKLARADVAAKRAIALAPEDGGSYAALSLIESDGLKFRTALRTMRRALALSPNQLGVVSPASQMILALGDRREALELSAQCIRLDPLAGRSYANMAATLFYLGQYSRSIDYNRKALALIPELTSAHAVIGHCLNLMGKGAEAQVAYEKASADDLGRVLGEAILAARSGNPNEAERKLARVRESLGAAGSYQYAQIYAQAQVPDRAFKELENGLRLKDPGLITLKVDPYLEPIRKDPRYGALLRRLDFPS